MYSRLFALLDNIVFISEMNQLNIGAHYILVGAPKKQSGAPTFLNWEHWCYQVKKLISSPAGVGHYNITLTPEGHNAYEVKKYKNK